MNEIMVIEDHQLAHLQGASALGYVLGWLSSALYDYSTSPSRPATPCAKPPYR